LGPHILLNSKAISHNEPQTHVFLSKLLCFQALPGSWGPILTIPYRHLTRLLAINSGPYSSRNNTKGDNSWFPNWNSSINTSGIGKYFFLDMNSSSDRLNSRRIKMREDSYNSVLEKILSKQENLNTSLSQFLDSEKNENLSDEKYGRAI
jgi:hypothetical protein